MKKKISKAPFRIEEKEEDENEENNLDLLSWRKERRQMQDMAKMVFRKQLETMIEESKQQFKIATAIKLGHKLRELQMTRELETQQHFQHLHRIAEQASQRLLETTEAMEDKRRSKREQQENFLTEMRKRREAIEKEKSSVCTMQ
ncbi:unnamed protein product [Dimorphilus gyrociliatus]|uniref:Uncharacterized protein n=1 Tax=Dimorphilus gyrociliatus TaxID=2664684 RepID=A0A7I8WDK6_9ANNE|nr:unnamed protein product [Dimorphilus gyrociliatus]